MKFLAILGRQPEISVAEIERLFLVETKRIGKEIALFELSKTNIDQLPTSAKREFNHTLVPNIDRLGGTMKLGLLITDHAIDFLKNLPAGRITLGLSDYSKNASAKNANKEAMKLKKILVRHGRSVRVLKNDTASLSTATSHHNQLGEKPGHVELIMLDREWYVGIGVQNITAYTKRDQARPARDAKIGMLPPKLAQILINLCGPLPDHSRILDPFCGTGVVLQEASLMQYQVYGTDLNPKMIDYTKKNLRWLDQRRTNPTQTPSSLTKSLDNAIIEGDATTFNWSGQIDAVACETYLGPPMSNPPVEIKLKTVKQECGGIILGFLKNIAPQIAKNTPLTIAVPAWLRPDGTYSRLSLIDEIEKLGYNIVNIGQKDLLYFREGQVVAREIIVLRKK